MTLAGQIGLIPHATNLFQLSIEAVTRSPVHHVIIATSDHVCVSAEMPTVRFRPTSHFPDAIWSDFILTDQQQDTIVDFVYDQVGKPYALGDDLLIGVVLLTRTHTPHWIEHHINSDNHWQCAELAEAAYWHAGINLFHDNRPAAAVYPGSFIPIWKDYGWWVDTRRNALNGASVDDTTHC